MANPNLPSLLDRHWAESALAIGAVLIAAVSLWVGYDTMRTDRMLVESSSWPFVQVYETDVLSGADPQTAAHGVNLVVANSGIAPAKIELFEVFWNGRLQHSPWQLLHSCCAVRIGPHGLIPGKDSLSFSSAHGIVLPAGQKVAFFGFTQQSPDLQAVATLRAHLQDLSFRYCYCSVFNQCWLVNTGFGHASLNPPRVSACPRGRSNYETQTPS